MALGDLRGSAVADTHCEGAEQLCQPGEQAQRRVCLVWGSNRCFFWDAAALVQRRLSSVYGDGQVTLCSTATEPGSAKTKARATEVNRGAFVVFARGGL